MDITVYTVIIGPYDNLRPPKVIEPGVRYVCVTDQPFRVAPWEIHPAFMPFESNARNSRIPKMLSHLHFDSEYTIYHDGEFVLGAAPSALIGELLQDADIAMYRHPCRTNIRQERDLCEAEHINDGPEMTSQVDRYLAIGVPDGLWAGGFIARRNTPQMARFNETWWSEYLGGCLNDQIALTAAKMQAGINIHTIDADILTDAARIQFCFHAAFVDCFDNGQHVGWWQDRARKNARIAQLCGVSL